MLGRGLSKVPGRRWNSASAMVASLQRALPAANVDETEATRAMPPPTRTAPKQTPPKSAPSRKGAKRPPTRTGARRSVAIGPAGAGAAAAEAGAHGSTGAAGPPTSTGAPPFAGFPPRRRPSRRILAVAAALVAIVALVAAIASAASSSGGGKVLAARVDHDTLKRAQDAADGRAAARRAKRSQNQDAAQTPEAPAAGTQPASSSNDSGSTGAGNTAALNQQGFDLLNAGKVNEAIPVLQKAVDGCGSDPSNLTCAYAMFNLAHALRLAGRNQEAVALLEKRLQNPDQRATVQRELDAARGGATPGGAPAPGAKPKPSKPDRPKGHEKSGKGGGDNGD